MNEKTNVPGEIFLGNQDYSIRSDWQVNGWLFVATIISALCDIIFAHTVRQWPLGWRAVIVLTQFVALALWARSLVVWVRGMDEMHRRITTASILFAVSATFFFVLLWHRLNAIGLFNVIFSVPKPGNSWDIGTVAHSFLLLTLFYFIGHKIFNRRYK